MKLKIGEKIFQIEVEEITSDLIKIKINNNEYFFLISNEDIVRLEREKISELPQLIKQEKIKKQREIKAPLAGQVSCIFVTQGEEIKSGQRLLSLISMKMENDIISEQNGKIKEIKVKKGQIVQKDDILIILE